MVSRRSFLLALSTIGLNQWISGCSKSPETVKILLLSDSIPVQLLKEFRKQLPSSERPIWKAKSQLKDLFELLTTWQDGNKNLKAEVGKFSIPWKKQETIADLITLGDYWLEEAIQQKLIQPLSLERLSGWEKLPLSVQNLAQGAMVAGNGQVWGAPYRWGATAIAYRRDKLEQLGFKPEDWQDLWRKELTGRISLLNQPREVIGLTLKKLGYSYNTMDLDLVPELKQELLALQQQVKFYRSENYLQPLILGDTWLAVGWSTDILPIQKRNSDIEVVIPRSGTSLWADLWVQPKQLSNDSEKESIIERWINFCWQPDIANKISFYTSAVSPILFNLKEEEISQDLQGNPFILRDEAILQRSEFLSPLTKDVQKKYDALWKEIRNQNN